MINLILQVHITGQCNLKCKHCYVDKHKVEMSFSDLKKILKQYDEWAKYTKKTSKQKVVRNLHITGGEPLLHSQFDKILRYLFFRRSKYRIAFMTNGTMLNKRYVRIFKTLKIKPLQVSLDGDREGHDYIRGEGNFDKVVAAIDLLNKYNMPCRVSFTANKHNYTQFSRVADICREHNVSSLWSDRYIPCNDELCMVDRENMPDYVNILRKESNASKNGKLIIENRRALQFLNSNEIPYYCKAGDLFVAIDENGDIFPCRRLPISCGNIKTSKLLDVYLNSEVFSELRTHIIPQGCKECQHREKCLGGAKCMSYALTGDYNAKDPSCFM